MVIEHPVQVPDGYTGVRVRNTRYDVADGVPGHETVTGNDALKGCTPFKHAGLDTAPLPIGYVGTTHQQYELVPDDAPDTLTPITGGGGGAPNSSTFVGGDGCEYAAQPKTTIKRRTMRGRVRVRAKCFMGWVSE